MPRSPEEHHLTAILALFQTTLRILGYPRVDLRTCLSIVIRHWMDRHPLYRTWSDTMKDEFTRWMIDWLSHEPWLREWLARTLATTDSGALTNSDPTGTPITIQPFEHFG